MNKFGGHTDSRGMYGSSALHVAALEGYFDGVKMLMRKFGTEARVTNLIGQTPLHVATNVDVIKLLVLEGRTPLHNAVRGGHFKFRANVNAETEYGKTLRTLSE